MGKMKIEYSNQAEKFLDKQNDKTFFRITSAIDKLRMAMSKKCRDILFLHID